MNCEAGFLVRTDRNGDQRQMGLGLTMPRDSGEAGSVLGGQGREFSRETQSSGLAKVHGGEGETQRVTEDWGSSGFQMMRCGSRQGSSHTRSTRGSHWRDRG